VSAAAAPILRTDGLVKSFRRRTVVREVAIEVAPGEVVGLLGPNGAGKTTTFRMVVGLLKPNRGRIYFGGQDVTRLPMYKRARAGMAYRRAERDARADALIHEFGIAHVAGNPAYALSGGERRRTEIARALAMDPRVFLLDEPFAGIDPIAVADLQQTVAQLKEKGIGVLITDHNVRDTLAITDRAFIISEGTISVSGTPREIAENPVARKTYLGERFRLE
jgi:lipopolysaccharide export system ATP-binding protein